MNPVLRWLTETHPGEELPPQEPAPSKGIGADPDKGHASGRRSPTFGRWPEVKHPADLFISAKSAARSAYRAEDYRAAERAYDRRQARRQSQPKRQPAPGLSPEELAATRTATIDTPVATVGSDLVLRAGGITFRLLGLVDRLPERPPDRPATCSNPAGCRAPVHAAGRCRACHEYRRTHRGEERPGRLVERSNRRLEEGAA